VVHIYGTQLYFRGGVTTVITPPPIELIRYVEELAANAWPAEVVQVVAGWRLRYTHNVSQRANSVWPNEAHEADNLVEKVALVEEFYRRWGCPARFQICPAAQPARLDDFLVKRGYVIGVPTAVQTATIETVLARIEVNSSSHITISETFDERWFAAYCQSEGVKPEAAVVRRGILKRIGPRTGFASLIIADQIAAVGLSVVERGWLGLFNLTTRPQFRRQGAAMSLIHAVAQWSQQYQANQIYLQVMTDNAPALNLYARLGFATLYHYHYRALG
jgi:GNAT superfamily N-acetyltransferase